MFSFINIFDTFKEISTKHRQINTFGFGDLWEIATSGTIDYPLMFVIPDGAISGRGEVGNKFKVLVMDKVLKDEGNENDVLSDTQQILLDVITTLKDGNYSFHLKKDDRIPLEDFTERFNDDVSGWTADITLWSPYDGSRCDVPTQTLDVGVPYSFSDAVYKNSNNSYNKSIARSEVHSAPDITVVDALGQSSTTPANTNITISRANTFSCAELNGELTQAQRQLIQRVNPIKTGQTTSYRTGDDGDLEKGRLSSFLVLDCNNSFGNTNRFTDDAGGQTYANNYVIDHATGLGWLRTLQEIGSWNTAIDSAEAYATLFTDWRIPNVSEIISLANYELLRVLNYSPFNLGGGAAVHQGLYTSTTDKNDTTFAWYLPINEVTPRAVGRILESQKIVFLNYLFCRNHF